MAQKLAPSKKIAEIYLQYLQLFASLIILLTFPLWKFALQDFVLHIKICFVFFHFYKHYILRSSSPVYNIINLHQHHRLFLQDAEVEGLGPLPPPGMQSLQRRSCGPQTDCKYLYIFLKFNT